MNQRIRELVVRLVPDAFMTYKGYLYHSSDPKVFEHSDPEPLYTKQELVKFAALIIEECMEVSLGCSHRDDDMGAIIARQIKQHFGV